MRAKQCAVSDTDRSEIESGPSFDISDFLLVVRIVSASVFLLGQQSLLHFADEIF